MNQSSFMNTFSSTMGADTPVISPAVTGNLFDKAVLLSISIGTLGTKKKVKPGTVTSDADQDFIHVSKDILQSETLDAIRKFDNATRKWIADRALPSQFRAGVYLWPIALVLEADECMRGRIDQRGVLVDRFMMVYAAARAAAQSALGSLYNERDYPDAEKVRGMFTQSYQFIECSTPGSLSAISPAIFAAEKEKAAANWSNALEECRALLRTQLVGLVEHMQDRLTPDADGTRKRFKVGLVENFNQFLTLFDARNLSDDIQLKGVVDECKALLTGATTEAVKTDDSLRTKISAGISGIKSALDAFVVDQGRAINLEANNEDLWGDL